MLLRPRLDKKEYQKNKKEETEKIITDFQWCTNTDINLPSGDYIGYYDNYYVTYTDNNTGCKPYSINEHSYIIYKDIK